MKEEKIAKIVKIAAAMSQFLKDDIDYTTIIPLQSDDDMEIKCDRFVANYDKFIVIAYDYGDGQIRCQID